MSDNLARVRAREAEAIAWIDSWRDDGSAAMGPSNEHSIFERSAVIDGFCEGFERGAIAGRAEWALIESLALVEARDLIAEAAALLRGYEKHHRDEAFRLNMGTDQHRDRIAKAQRNAAMAAKLEVWLSPRPECAHEKTVMHETGDGVPVEFCPECGRNIALAGKSLIHGVDLSNPADVLRAVANRIAIDAGLSVDHESFDRAAAHLREVVDLGPHGDEERVRDNVVPLARPAPPVGNLRPVTEGPLADSRFVAEIVGAEPGDDGPFPLVLNTPDPRFDPTMPVIINGYGYRPMPRTPA